MQSWQYTQVHESSKQPRELWKTCDIAAVGREVGMHGAPAGPSKRQGDNRVSLSHTSLCIIPIIKTQLHTVTLLHRATALPEFPSLLLITSCRSQMYRPRPARYVIHGPGEAISGSSPCGILPGEGRTAFFLGVSNCVPLAEMDPCVLSRGSGFPISKHGGCER